MIQPIPAPGYTKITGKRRPPKSWGDELHCQLRNGHIDPFGKPWPVKDVRWVHDETDGDVVAVRKAA